MANNFEIIINLDSQVVMADKSLKQWTIDEAIGICEQHNCQYIASPHVPDEACGFNHWHLGIHTKSDNTYDTIASWFGLPVNSVQKIKKHFNTTYACYLIHLNQDGKTPVDFHLVRTNTNIDFEKLIEKYSGVRRLDDILEKIDNGEIKPYNLYQFVSLREYTKWKRQLDNAFEFRSMRLKNNPRNMDCIFISGDSGIGKTTYAKKICNDRGLWYYVSSGSNDILSDYASEPAIILDDLRPSSFSLSDLLKMLDNNTASSVKSRYRNKFLETKLIVITSTLEIDKFFSQVFENNNETKVQLMRRCSLYIIMSRKDMVIKVYDKESRGYKTVSVVDNPYCRISSDNVYTSDGEIDYVASILGCDDDFIKELEDGNSLVGYISIDDIPF